MLKALARSVGISSILLLAGCTGSGDSAVTGAVTDISEITARSNAQFSENYFRCGQRATDWTKVNSWHYQLLNMDYKAMADSGYNLIVMDSEPPGVAPSRNAIDRIKCDGNGEKLVVSYLAVGQAENYRYYWQPDWKVGSPEWIAYPDLYWPGDFYVRYWEPVWRDILMGSPNSRVDRIIAAGFDGIYLDTIDGYELFLDENPNAIEDMRQLIADISNYARAKSGNPDFGVFVQNAEELIQTYGPSWVEPLTGIGKEEPFYWATDTRVQDDLRYWNDLYLKQWVDAGKLVINVDYVTKPELAAEAARLSREKGYIPLALPDKDLNTMPGF